jgi:hypothetical protein
MKTDTPLACNMGVFTPIQRENHIQVTTQLIQAIQSVREVEHGYEFLFPNETEIITKIAEFVSNERLCCPFVQFTLNVDSNSKPVSLSLAGPVGTQEFLRAEFDGAFQ